ncbi:hypothetical protein D3C85_1159830 [compost metagenome]
MRIKYYLFTERFKFCGNRQQLGVMQVIKISIQFNCLIENTLCTFGHPGKSPTAMSAYINNINTVLLLIPFTVSYNEEHGVSSSRECPAFLPENPNIMPWVNGCQMGYSRHENLKYQSHKIVTRLNPIRFRYKEKWPSAKSYNSN